MKKKEKKEFCIITYINDSNKYMLCLKYILRIYPLPYLNILILIIMFLCLISFTVSTTLYSHKLQTLGRPNSEQVNELLRYVRTEGHYTGLVSALIESCQQDVVTQVLQEDLQEAHIDLKPTGMCVRNQLNIVSFDALALIIN